MVKGYNVVLLVSIIIAKYKRVLHSEIFIQEKQPKHFSCTTNGYFKYSSFEYTSTISTINPLHACTYISATLSFKNTLVEKR